MTESESCPGQVNETKEKRGSTIGAVTFHYQYAELDITGTAAYTVIQIDTEGGAAEGVKDPA